MNNNFEFLVEKEEMWAKMLIEVLKDNNIPCISFPVYGVGLVIKTGKKEILKIFVPSENLEQASELVQELFSGEPLEEYE